MLWALVKGALISIFTWVIWQLVRPLVSKSSLNNLPGPRPQSLWQGNLPQLFDRHGWAIQDDIDKQGRAVVRITGLFNRPALYVFDPKAMQHIVIKDLPVYERSEVIAA
ncbi:hypothetical protein EIP86_005549 [Pleurotus ostreatoroseus]|nr:hypothetical protein EIP86_005549 [Pleurotus ostreatoroseus]